MVSKTGVLFVCLGNICRSPLAEGIFRNQIRARGIDHRFDVDSCGTGSWHRGEPADSRSIAVGSKYGLAINHRARSFSHPSDSDRFRWLIAMDRSNVRNLIKAGAPESSIRLIRSFDPATIGKKDLDVPDPYSGDDGGFEVVYHMLAAACGGLVEFLIDELES